MGKSNFCVLRIYAKPHLIRTQYASILIPSAIAKR